MIVKQITDVNNTVRCMWENDWFDMNFLKQMFSDIYEENMEELEDSMEDDEEIEEYEIIDTFLDAIDNGDDCLIHTNKILEKLEGYYIVIDDYVHKLDVPKRKRNLRI